jgi:uncharacterized protein (DUF1330 family)
MSALLVTLARVDHDERYARYAELATHAAALHGARFLTRGAPLEVMEGELGANRAVVAMFGSAQQARDYYFSREYQAARRERLGAARFEMVLADLTGSLA